MADGPVLDARGLVGLAWSTLFGFTRLVTSRRVVGDDAAGLSEAWGAVVTLLRQPTARLIEPAPTHAATAGRLLAPPGLSFNDVPDVHLAALALDHGLVLCSHDQGFARVDGLRWTDPLTA